MTLVAVVVGAAVLFMGGRLFIGLCLPSDHWLSQFCDQIDPSSSCNTDDSYGDGGDGD